MRATMWMSGFRGTLSAVLAAAVAMAAAGAWAQEIEETQPGEPAPMEPVEAAAPDAPEPAPIPETATPPALETAPELDPAPELAPAAEEPELAQEPAADVEPVAGPAPEPAPEPAVTWEDGDFFPLPALDPTKSADMRKKSDNLISITVDDVPLEDVVRMFTRISGANIIATPSNLVGSVTVNLTDVEWRPALSAILGMHSLYLVEEELGSGVYTIQHRPPDAPEPLISKSFKLKFSSVADVSPVIQTMLPEGATLSEFHSRNILVVRTTAESLREIELLIREIDIPTRQVCIETQFVELNDEASKQIGIRWDSLEEFGVALSADPFSYNRAEQTTDASEESYSSTSSDTENEQNVQYYDINGVQFQEQTITYQESPPGSGIYVPEITLTPTTTIEDQQIDQEISTFDTLNSFARVVTEQQSAILDIDTFELVLSALKRTDGVSIVSNPKIIIANGETNAYFRVGNREPIIEVTLQQGTQDSPGDLLIAELDTEIETEYISGGFLRTGVELRVVPVIKTDDLIEATIEPRLVRKLSDKAVNENTWPVLAVKELKTKFTLRSGQTVAIGGLTDTADQKRTSKIPLLGDLPLIGRYLFSHTEDVKAKMETIIFVSLSIADAENLSEEVGIPNNAELIHRKRLQQRARRSEFEQEIQRYRETLDSEDAARAHRAKARLLQQAD